MIKYFCDYCNKEIPKKDTDDALLIEDESGDISKDKHFHHRCFLMTTAVSTELKKEVIEEHPDIFANYPIEVKSLNFMDL